jgi:uncharacterized RDD family membrane protein YckC
MNILFRLFLPGAFVALLLPLALSSFAQPAPAEEEDRSQLRRIDQFEVPAEPSRASPNRRSQSRRDGSGDFRFGDISVPPGGRMRGAVSIFGSTTVSGEVDSDAVSVGGSTFILPGGRVGGAAVAVLGRLESQGEIRHEAVSVLGGMTINGPVGGEAVSVLGNMDLGPNAVVEGDVVVVGGRLTRNPDAIVRGNEVGVPVFADWGDFGWFTSWLKRCIYYGRLLAFDSELGWAWTVAFSFLGLYLLLAVLFSRGVMTGVETLETRPGFSILTSVLTVLLTPVTIILLALTIVGALLVPFVGAALLFATLFGKVVVLAWIGRRFTRLWGDEALRQPVFAVLIGGLVALLLYTVPVLGLLSYKLLSWLGLGVVVYAIALSISREKSLAARGPAGVPPYMPVAPTTPYPAAPPDGPTAFVPAPAVTGVAPAATMSAGFSGTSSGGAEASDVPESGTASELPAMEQPGISAPPPHTPPPVSALPPPPPAPPPSAAFSAYGTPQPPAATVVDDGPRAGFFIRLGALAIDGILVGLIMGFVSGLLPRFLDFQPGPGGWLVALAIYGAIMWKHKGTTIGGIVCGLKVVRVDHRELDWPTVVVRALACFLSLAVAGLGFIWVAIDDDKQSWHDKIAGTAVVFGDRRSALVDRRS